MSIDRTELERLLADRPSGNRSAMQAVRDSYGDIGLMRERGLSWAEISEVLARLGVSARDNQPISAVTLRSAFFLVGAEMRGEDGEVAPLAAQASFAAMAPEPEPRIEFDRAPQPQTPAPEPPAPEPPAVEPLAAEPSAPEPLVAEAQPRPQPEFAPALISPALIPPAPFPPAPIPLASVLPASAPDIAPDLEPIVESPGSTFPLTNSPLKGASMLGTILVLNDRGGVGKTLLTHHLMATAMLDGLQFRVVEYEVNERLASLFGPEVVEHRRISQDFMNMMGGADGFYEFWDQIGPELQRGGRLFDFGGNISQWFFNWAEVSGFDYYVGEGERLTFMVPVTVDLASLQTGMSTLERIATIAPKAKRVLVENGVSGPFSQLEDSNYGRRKAEMVEREGVHVVTMAPCTAPAWARLTGHRLDQVAQMTREDLVKLGMTPPVASRSLIIIHEWLRNLRQSLAPFVGDAFRQTPSVGGKPVGGGRQGVI